MGGLGAEHGHLGTAGLHSLLFVEEWDLCLATQRCRDGLSTTCTYAHVCREDAPPGGYLAGFAGSYRDSYPGLHLQMARYSLILQQRGTEMYTEFSPAVNYIHEVRRGRHTSGITGSAVVEAAA